MLRLARLAAFALALGAAPVAAQAAACGPTYGADGLAVGADGGLWLTHYEDARLAYRTPDGRWHDRETLVAGKPVGLSGLRLDEERGVAWAVSADSTKIIRISLRDGSANATALDGVILHHRGPLPGDGAGGLWVLSAAAGASWLEQPFLWHIGADGKVLERKALPVDAVTQASVTSDGAGRPWVLLHRLGSKPPELFTWRDGVVMRDLLSESGTSVAGLAVDRKGTVWLTVPTHNALGEWRGGRLTLHPLPTARALPIAVVAAEDGGVWVTEWDGRKLARYDGAGKWREYPVPEGEDAPIALAFARDGGVWFSTLLAYDVFRLDPASGAVTRHAVPPPALAAANSAYGACAVPTGEGAKDVVSLPASRHPRLYPSPPAVQLESYCNTGCHTWQRVEQAGQRRTDWTATVDRMIDVNGAPLSPEQRTILIQYLNATYVRGQK